MSILTTIIHGEGHFELVNDFGTIVGQLTEEIKNHLLHNGILEKVIIQD